MPCNYDIPNVNDVREVCNYCNGSGYQMIGSLGYRACQYCITGWKVRSCEWCQGKGCENCIGHKHSFYSENASGSSYAPPDTGARPYAGEVAPAPARTILRR